jgi:ABC-2 type transport system ATP-binding protein
LAYFDQTLDRGMADAKASALALDPGRLSARVGTYSKGIGQKLGLLGALLPARPLLVLDEPMSGLDPEARAALKSALRAEAEAGRTVFFSSHGLSDVDEICDRVGVLHDQRMKFVGSVPAFHEAYPTDSLEQAFLAAIAA